jgi:hypothetical protein
MLKPLPDNNDGTGDAHTPVFQEYHKEHIRENGFAELASK